MNKKVVEKVRAALDLLKGAAPAAEVPVAEEPTRLYEVGEVDAQIRACRLSSAKMLAAVASMDAELAAIKAATVDECPPTPRNDR